MNRVAPGAGSAPRYSWRALAIQSGMSFLLPSSLERTASTSPIAAARTAAIKAINGPGQKVPRASISLVIITASMLVSPLAGSDEQSRPAVGLFDKAGNARHL